MGFLVSILIAICLDLTGVCALAQAPTNAADSAYQIPDSPGALETSVKNLESRLTDARASLAAAAALGDAALSTAPAGILPQDFSLRRPLLQRLVRLYEQQLANAAELETTRTRKAELVREAKTWTQFAEPPPYSILLTDRLREERQTLQLKISNLETTAAALEQLIQENRNSIVRTDERIRQLNEQLEGTPNPAVSARLIWQRELERLRNQVAGATVTVLGMERLLGQEVVTGSRIRLDLLQRQIVIADVGTKFTQTDLDQITSQFERERGQLERELAEVQTRRDAILRELASAREELRRLQTRPDSSPQATARAAETVSARAAQLEMADTASRVLRLLLEGGNLERSMWEMRFAASESGKVEALRESGRRLAGIIGRVALWREREHQQTETSSSQIQLQEKRVNDLDPNSDLLPMARERLAALRESDQYLRRLSRAIEGLQRLTQRWEDGLRAAEIRLPLTGRLQNLFSDTRLFLRRLWLFELFIVEDTITVDGQKITGKRSVTVSKIVMAAFILVGGIWLTGLLSRLTEPIIIRRFKIERNQASLIRRWLRAAMVLWLVLFSLVSAKIPLTVFAFAGGALAIGLGFGTQTLLKNFVSGLILLFERPFRVGDILDLGEQKGTVTGIGLRACVLELWDGKETLIPNSFLLENNVTNWTYTNRKVRFPVTVGVAYGSDPRRIIQLLDEVAARHGLVEKEPKPQVFLTEFGDSAMTLELRYWVDVVRANAAQVSSDLRLMIAASFAEHGIVIAFPQRDIHLHANGPIPVEVVAAGGRAKDVPNPNLGNPGTNEAKYPEQWKRHGCHPFDAERVYQPKSKANHEHPAENLKRMKSVHKFQAHSVRANSRPPAFHRVRGSFCPLFSALFLLLTGCQHLGPKTVTVDRFDYSSAIGESWKQQILLNIVKMRYMDLPVFVDVASIVSSYSMQSGVSVNGTLSSENAIQGNFVAAGGQAIYTDRPTITYVPMTGEKFLRGLITPIDPKNIFSMLQSGYAADFILGLTVESLNGVRNRSAAGGAMREADPEFVRALELIRDVQAAGAFGMRVEEDKLKGSTGVVFFRRDDVAADIAAKAAEVRQLLKLRAAGEKFVLTYSPVRGSENELAVNSRSMLQILAAFASYMDVPEAHVKDHSVAPSFLKITPETGKDPVQIHSGKDKPANAYAAVRYRDHWFWVDVGDWRTKRAMSAIAFFFTLAETGGSEKLPLITIPAQ